MAVIQNLKSKIPADLLGRVQTAYALASAELVAARQPSGHWTGDLSSSALSTATAVTALVIASPAAEPRRYQSRVQAGLSWLAAHNNADGGWGDTILSLSNLSTTTLCWAAWGAAERLVEQNAPTGPAEDWIRRHVGGLEPDSIARAIIARYGKDRTFSVPILTLCALAGRLGDGREAWRHVLPLPFELAACPPRWFATLRLPVVSYALPALIAMGLARHHHAPSANPVARLVRNLAQARTLGVLTAIQPVNGGFLEATPLTSFVTMSLAGSGHADHPVVGKGLDFLLASQRADGSWPIDTNLATWVTTLSVNALEAGQLGAGAKATICSWLLGQQYRRKHPYTQAAPGGWAWTDLPGGVPDADDTAGALLALRRLGAEDASELEAVRAGIQWLLQLQNQDGGIPTFCRGWGALPFDRSSADITAHVLRAWLVWVKVMPAGLQERLGRATARALNFLERTQHAAGCWAPLWFGNQHTPEEANLVYGTARVLSALAAGMGRKPLGGVRATALAGRAIAWFVAGQNTDGGWGGAPGVGSSVEETALAVEALLTIDQAGLEVPGAALAGGLRWLVERVESGRWREPSPIGFYFARLWYFERLYPVIFTVGALRAASGGVAE